VILKDVTNFRRPQITTDFQGDNLLAIGIDGIAHACQSAPNVSCQTMKPISPSFLTDYYFMRRPDTSDVMRQK